MRSSSSTWASRSPRRSSRSSCKFRDRPSAVAPERATPPHKEFTMIRPMIWRALALAVFAAGAPSAHAAVVLDGRVYRGTVDGHTHAVADSALTPFAVVVAFRPQGSAPVAAGQSLEQLEAALDALPYSASRVLAARVDGRFRAIAVRSEPKQQPPYRPLPEVIKEQQVVHTFDDVDGTLIGFRFPATTTSVNVPGWHFHFISADRGRGGHVLGLTTGAGLALLEEFSDLRISLPARAPASSAGAEAIKAVERPQ